MVANKPICNSELQPILERSHRFGKDIYAIACICGGLIYYLCMYLDLPAAPTQFIAACSVILIRILAVRYGISLPALKGETRPAPKEK